MLSDKKNRIRLEIQGQVQGIGFRPYIYNIAQKLTLTGWVKNSLSNIIIEIEGLNRNIEIFHEKILINPPVLVKIVSFKQTEIPVKNTKNFSIKQSEENLNKASSYLIPDLAICGDCTKEIFNKNNRRYLYPFNNCIKCGPRFTITKKLPYDRVNTSMQKFAMCDNCLLEYNNPMDRRFHAQAISCWDCGPKLSCSIEETCEAIKNGEIVAIKGIGGFHLCVDARNSDALKRLRTKKHRAKKPFAVMVSDLDMAKSLCKINKIEEEYLISKEAPIVLLEKLKNNIISKYVSPENNHLGLIIAYTATYKLLLQNLNFPIIVTSANISGEPICYKDSDMFNKLDSIADFYLSHDREILEPIDDSVIQICCGKQQMLRRTRGYSNYILNINNINKSILSVGGHLKNNFCISNNKLNYISQNFGDLESERTYKLFKNNIDKQQENLSIKDKYIACDLHPFYLSTKYAKENNKNIIYVQHHHAHVAACMKEKNITHEVLGIVWDGIGYGDDANFWGGEFLLCTQKKYKRVANFMNFKIPAVLRSNKDPRCSAIGVLYSVADYYKISISELLNKTNLKNSLGKFDRDLLIKLVDNSYNTYTTSSVGRIFDAVAAILGIINNKITFEGEAAQLLQYYAEKSNTIDNYEFKVSLNKKYIIDWRSIIYQIVNDFNDNIKVNIIAKKFHNTLVKIAEVILEKLNIKDIVCTGGCFQNKLLLTSVVKKLENFKYNVYFPSELPVNDGGIDFGQLTVAQANLGE